MTLGRAEFLRLLPAAVAGEAFALEEADGATLLTHRGAGRHWRIRLTPLPPLRLGAIALERTRVDLRFLGYPDDVFDRFLEHFQRGGG